jgi:hypothetical protein
VLSVANGGTDDPSNLAAVHDRNPPHCHRAKTAAERPARATTKRACEPKPGLIAQGTPIPPTHP